MKLILAKLSLSQKSSFLDKRDEFKLYVAILSLTGEEFAGGKYFTQESIIFPNTPIHHYSSPPGF